MLAYVRLTQNQNTPTYPTYPTYLTYPTYPTYHPFSSSHSHSPLPFHPSYKQTSSNVIRLARIYHCKSQERELHLLHSCRRLYKLRDDKTETNETRLCRHLPYITNLTRHETRETHHLTAAILPPPARRFRRSDKSSLQSTVQSAINSPVCNQQFTSTTPTPLRTQYLYTTNPGTPHQPPTPTPHTSIHPSHHTTTMTTQPPTPATPTTMTDDNPTPTPNPDRRRGSFSSATFSAIFGPRGAPANGTNGTPPSAPRQNPSPPSSTTSTTAALPTPSSRRRMSISTLGLSGSPLSTSAGATTFFPRDRRASIASSTASSLTNSAVSESAIEDDSPDSGSMPTTPFSRHMSFGGSSGLFPRGSGNGAGGVGPTSPQSKSRSPSDAGGLNWSEQFRERAASAVHRPMMGSSPPAAGGRFGSMGAQGGQGGPPHVRAKSEGGDQMMAQAPARTQPQPVPQRKERMKPDEVGERMLRGEFYMD